MSRSFRCSLLSVAVLLAGCDLDLFDEPLLSCEETFPTIPCVDEEHPLTFIGEIDGLAPGAEAEVSLLVDDSLSSYSVHSSDPDVVRAELDGNDNVILTGRDTGTSRIEAISGETGEVMESFSIEVARVATTDFFYYPGGDQAVAALAGVVGRSDTVHAIHRSADGARLVADGAVEYAVEGPLSLGGETEVRESDFVRAFSGRLVGRATVITFDGTGDGRLVARADGGGEFELPIRGVAAADRHRIEPTTELAVDTRALLLLRSTTDDGVTVAGVRGAWSVRQPDRAGITTQYDLASEAAVEPYRAGLLTVEVDLGDELAIQELQVDP